jgi:AcrR family transcriptional regulator
MSKQDGPSDQSEKQPDTKERIIAAASKVLAEKGYEAATLKEISREAQAAPGLVHYYFGGKDQLLVEVLRAAGQRFHRRMEQLVETMPADQSLEAVLTQLQKRVDQDPDVYRLRYESFSLGLHNPLIAPRVAERMAERRQELGFVMAKVIENTQREREPEAGARHPALDPWPLPPCYSRYSMGWRCKRSWTQRLTWIPRIVCWPTCCAGCSPGLFQKSAKRRPPHKISGRI